MVPVFNNVRERSMAKIYHPVSLSVVNKVSEKLANRIVVHLEKCLFSDFHMVLGLLDQLQIFLQLYLIELLGLLTCLGLLEL